MSRPTRTTTASPAKRPTIVSDGVSDVIAVLVTGGVFVVGGGAIAVVGYAIYASVGYIGILGDVLNGLGILIGVVGLVGGGIGIGSGIIIIIAGAVPNLVIDVIQPSRRGWRAPACVNAVSPPASLRLVRRLLPGDEGAKWWADVNMFLAETVDPGKRSRYIRSYRRNVPQLVWTSWSEHLRASDRREL